MALVIYQYSGRMALYDDVFTYLTRVSGQEDNQDNLELHLKTCSCQSYSFIGTCYMFVLNFDIAAKYASIIMLFNLNDYFFDFIFIMQLFILYYGSYGMFCYHRDIIMKLDEEANTTQYQEVAMFVSAFLLTFVIQRSLNVPPLMLILVYSSFYVPQIVSNLRFGTSTAPKLFYMVIESAQLLNLYLYLKINEGNILLFQTDLTTVGIVVAWVSIQILILTIQKRKGATEHDHDGHQEGHDDYDYKIVKSSSKTSS